jgi:cytochrome P450
MGQQIWSRQKLSTTFHFMKNTQTTFYSKLLNLVVFHFGAGKNYLQWFGPQAQMVITEPELIKEILNNRDNAYPKQDVGDYMKKLLGDGLVTSDGEKWAKMRKLANYAFHADSLKVTS